MNDTKNAGGALVTASLWLVLLVSAATNSIGQFAGLDWTFRMIAGAISVICIVLLIVRYVARRRA
ncbi:hypothetical protein ACFQ05_19055 [Amycolatopsis umgeniensis]|uniref:Membrane protein implicated in regulation of membrane protease activity n=1 Tax=Amycolatopsis umgeniensis TaxID=336628 RepID=A0A841BFV7_9PSEU|nr:hypothetical protein [Amycolatopsis umgeniensis]MBB5857708.1 membrane protein implicated in regulation of membrane protease activity [Amycolatopsis umgeniensis]